jgi:hypothetical protein
MEGTETVNLLKGKKTEISFSGEVLKNSVNRNLGEFMPIQVPNDADALYEATVFAADNNALEVRSLQRSGETAIPEVQAARDAFFNQKSFVERGVWDRNLFDGDLTTGFWQTKRYITERGCLRLDLGKIQKLDELIITVPDMYSLLPLLPEEGNYVEISTDLQNWEQLTFMTDLKIRIPVGKPVRYLRFNSFPQQITEIEGVTDGKSLDRSPWRASNLFAHPRFKKPLKSWKTSVVLDEIPKGSYLCVAINGKHGREGAYAAAKVDGKMIGAPDRAPSHLCNPWESFNARTEKNNTYYIPLNEEYIGKNIEVFVMGYDKEILDYSSELWITAYPQPMEKIKLVLNRK